MKIITFSDLHLEFGIDFKPPEDSAADVMVLAGDIITFRDYDPLSRFLEDLRIAKRMNGCCKDREWPFTSDPLFSFIK